MTMSKVYDGCNERIYEHIIIYKTIQLTFIVGLYFLSLYLIHLIELEFCIDQESFLRMLISISASLTAFTSIFVGIFFNRKQQLPWLLSERRFFMFDVKETFITVPLCKIFSNKSSLQKPISYIWAVFSLSIISRIILLIFFIFLQTLSFLFHFWFLLFYIFVLHFINILEIIYSIHKFYSIQGSQYDGVFNAIYFPFAFNNIYNNHGRESSKHLITQKLSKMITKVMKDNLDFLTKYNNLLLDDIEKIFFETTVRNVVLLSKLYNNVVDVNIFDYTVHAITTTNVVNYSISEIDFAMTNYHHLKLSAARNKIMSFQTKLFFRIFELLLRNNIVHIDIKSIKILDMYLYKTKNSNILVPQNIMVEYINFYSKSGKTHLLFEQKKYLLFKNDIIDFHNYLVDNYGAVMDKLHEKINNKIIKSYTKLLNKES